MIDLPTEVEKYTAEYEAKKASFKNTGAFERPEVMIKKGARFYLDEDGIIMFVFKLDVNNEHVAKATDEHRAKYPTEWMTYIRSLKGKK